MQKQTTTWGPTTDFGLSSDEMREEVQFHLLRHIGGVDMAFHDQEGWAGRGAEDGPPVDVLVSPPQGERRFAYVASFGCSFKPLPAKAYADRGQRRRVEFVLAAPQKGVDAKADRAMLDLCANTVRRFAKLVHLNPVSCEPGETVAFSENPEPLFADSDQCGFAFMVPRLPSDGFASLKLGDGEEVRFIAPVPVSRVELEAARQHGASALTTALVSGGITEMLDLKRGPVAQNRQGGVKDWWAGFKDFVARLDAWMLGLFARK